MKFYDQLFEQTEVQRNYLLTAPIIEDVVVGRFDIKTYIAFLNQAYHHVRHTVPLLMAAGARLSSNQAYLQLAIIEYIEAEAGHEQWVLDDIETAGFCRADFAEALAPYHSEIMVSYLYDTVQRGNPVGIFGMVLVLEGTSAGLASEVGRIVQQTLKLPDTAMSYLTSHGALDKEHIAGFETLMNTIHDPMDQAAIIHVANNMYQLYGDVYRAIPGEAQLLSEAVAA